MMTRSWKLNSNLLCWEFDSKKNHEMEYDSRILVSSVNLFYQDFQCVYRHECLVLESTQGMIFVGFYFDSLMQACHESKVKETWWRHQMETFSALLAICAGNSPVPGEFPTQRPVTRSFDVYFDLRLNKRLSKQSWGWWFETPLRSLWRHRNETS